MKKLLTTICLFTLSIIFFGDFNDEQLKIAEKYKYKYWNNIEISVSNNKFVCGIPPKGKIYGGCHLINKKTGQDFTFIINNTPDFENTMLHEICHWFGNADEKYCAEYAKKYRIY